MLSGKKILICGAEGISGRAATKLCLNLNGTVFLSDIKKTDTITEVFWGNGKGLHDFRPRQEPELLDEIRPDFILIAPGISLQSEIIVAAQGKDIPVYGEIDFAFHAIRRLWKHPPFIIGITGTDGKSTTTALLTTMIQEATNFHAVACGNYGLPLSTLALDPALDSPGTVFVTECSSFQLEYLNWFHPEISIILNFARDHLDRHQNMESYFHAKLQIVSSQTGSDFLLAPGDILEKIKEYKSKINLDFQTRRVDSLEIKNKWIIYKNVDLLKMSDFPLPGRHNHINLAFALEALAVLSEIKKQSLNLEKLAKAIKSFHGLSHRLEIIGEKDGISFVNDSKATTINAVLTAIQSYRSEPQHRIYLLCGGRDKGANFKLLPDPDENFILFPFGEAAHRIKNSKKTENSFNDLDSAFTQALNKARFELEKDSKPLVVLLSPGCASFDAYNSYQERGEHFRRLVKKCLN